MTSPDDRPPRRQSRPVGADAGGRAQLAAEIDRYVRLGYRVASETAISVSLVRPRRFGCLPFVVLLLLGVFPAVIYVAWYLSRRDETVYLRLEDGRLRRGGEPGETSSATGVGVGRLLRPRPLAVLAFVVILAVMLLGRGGGGGVQPSPAETRAPSRSTLATGQTPSRTPTVTPTAAPETYTVVAGDTLPKIATRFGVGLAELVELNGIADPSLIEVGQLLILPSSVATDPLRGADYERFTRLLEEGAGCGALFDARAKIDKTDADYADASADLRSVECFSAQSTRGEEQADDRSPDWITQYRLSHMQCSFSAEQLYAEARTRDPQRAAEWLSEIFVPGDRRDGSSAGCYDALGRIASRYP